MFKNGAWYNSMILGIGLDSVEIKRFYGKENNNRFLNRIFTEAEQTYARAKHNPAAAYAKRFAAKEALVKAVGTGIGPLSFLDIEVINDERGRPYITLTDKALQIITLMMPAHRCPYFHLSISDTNELAQAIVLFEGREA